MSINTFLFDLDGTLVDTAPDLARALNHLRAEENYPPLPMEAIRPWCGLGAGALVSIGLELTPSHPSFSSYVQRFLVHYNRDVFTSSYVFEGLHEVIDLIHQHDKQWGIVTNKNTALTLALLSHVQWSRPPACIVCGDTLTKRKPDPEPILHAMHLLQSTKASTLFIGDSPVDVQAATSAGVDVVWVSYGYHAPEKTTPVLPHVTHCMTVTELLAHVKTRLNSH